LLPPFAAQKRLAEGRFLDCCGRWGYQEVLLPLLEPAAANGAGKPPAGGKVQYLAGSDGEVMALRSDLTMTVARLVARLSEEESPLRLAYQGSVFRREPGGGGVVEVFQAGAELIGLTGAEADAEVIAVAVQAVREMGLPRFQVAVGHAGLLHYLVEGLGLDSGIAARLRQALSRRDLAAVREMIGGLEVDDARRRILAQAIMLDDGPLSLERIGPLLSGTAARQALEEFKALPARLAAYGARQHVALDLGVVRDFDYYTGFVFEIYADGLGHPVGGGGRYDHLLDRHGRDLPAAGFAVDTGRIVREAAAVTAGTETEGDRTRARRRCEPFFAADHALPSIH